MFKSRASPQDYNAPTMSGGLLSIRSHLLDGFRASGKGGTWQLRDIAGFVVEFSRDQRGSLFIQNELPNTSGRERRSVFDEIVPSNTLEPIQDILGNYVIHKLFEHGTQAQKTMLANTLAGDVFYLSCSLYGCRVVQKAIESILPEQQASFVRELEPPILECVKDSNGNHVIQKVIQRSSGSQVLQQFLEHLPDVQTQPPLDELLANHISRLVQDQFGNYLIPFIFERGRRPEDNTLIVAQLRGHLLLMAQNKFASNEIMAPPDPSKPDAATPIVIMMNDRYANYVLQRALAVAESESTLLFILYNTYPARPHNRRFT
ncbi:armadillo-type protein [Mycena olivaceomarginata]|nr:armadillo-type protein [Mycena olivaceomarginata]